MGIGGTGVGGTSQPPQIRESETTAFNEIMKKNVLGMIQADSVEVVPFTQPSYDEVYKYKAEADKPTLHGLMTLRGGVEEDEVEENWQQNYQSLMDNLPTDLQEMLKQEAQKPLNERSLELTELNGLLVGIAKGKEWIAGALQPIAAESAAERRQIMNTVLPYIAFKAVLRDAQSVLLNIQNQLDHLGPNYSGYDKVVGFLVQAKDDVKELDDQRKKLAENNDASSIKERMLDIAADLARLNALYKNTDPGEGSFQIGGKILEAMGLVSESWAMEKGSPSLLLALGVAFEDNQPGALGQVDNALLDSMLDGLLTAIPKGPQVQLEEMNSLYNSLAELK